MRFFLLILIVIGFASCKNNEVKDSNIAIETTSVDSLKAKVLALAIRDYDLKQCKYYFNTISIAPKEFVAKAAAYNVNVITKNCVLDTEEMMYNKFVDSIYLKNSQIRISELL